MFTFGITPITHNRVNVIIIFAFRLVINLFRFFLFCFFCAFALGTPIPTVYLCMVIFISINAFRIAITKAIVITYVPDIFGGVPAAVCVLYAFEFRIAAEEEESLATLIVCLLDKISKQHF